MDMDMFLERLQKNTENLLSHNITKLEFYELTVWDVIRISQESKLDILREAFE